MQKWRKESELQRVSFSSQLTEEQRKNELLKQELEKTKQALVDSSRLRSEKEKELEKALIEKRK